MVSGRLDAWVLTPMREYLVMATTLKQIAANQANSAKSTGPRTDEGKERSRENAIKHGMAGASMVLTADLREEIERRLITMGPTLATGDALGDWFGAQAIMATAKIDQIQAAELNERGRITADAQGEGERWLGDQVTSVLFLSGSVKRRPERAHHELLQTIAGCDWLDHQWLGLLMALDPEISASFRGTPEPGWTEDQRNRALDLAGVSPTNRIAYHARFAKVADSATFAQEQRELIAKARPLARTRDSELRADAQVGINLERHPDLVRIRRYEANAQRDLKTSLAKHAHIVTRLINDAKSCEMMVESSSEAPVEAKIESQPEPPQPENPSPIPIAVPKLKTEEPLSENLRADVPQASATHGPVGNRRLRRAMLARDRKAAARR